MSTWKPLLRYGLFTRHSARSPLSLRLSMAHYDTFREQLAIAHPAFGHALWDPGPEKLHPSVQVGDVGFIRHGKFHRLFNALLSADDPSHERRGAPHDHEPLRLQVHLQDHIDHGILSPNNFHSYGVSVVSGGLDVLATGVGSADVSFSCTKKQGAVLSLPVTARREDTLHLGHFRKYILRHINSWFAFACELGMGIKMEDIILVTGCHRTRSWTNTVFNEVQANARVSIGVEVGAIDASVNWRVSNFRVQGAVHGRGPVGRNLPENQCIFIRGFRVKRFLFGLVPRIKGAAEPKPDTRGNDGEPEKEVVPIPSFTKYRDPLHVLLEYIAKQAPDCDMALVHDDDLERILGASDRPLETLKPDVMMDYLKRSKPEIGVMSNSFLANDQSPRTDTGHMTVAMLSKHLKSLGAPTSVPLVAHFPGGTTNREGKAHCLLEAQEGATEYTEVWDICVNYEMLCNNRATSLADPACATGPPIEQLPRPWQSGRVNPIILVRRKSSGSRPEESLVNASRMD
ncbi:hypothetical protein EDB89DRAFT_1301200 [Lactarius sanguifluus]|nr:hypothetical protein EDB89DRAFT_1301200 [Lactarius sanguifluus]